MKYNVVVPATVQKEIDDLPDEIAEKIIQKILPLRDNPRPPDCIKRKGLNNEYRIRMRSYRIRYAIFDEESTVVILHCGHRKDIYRS